MAEASPARRQPGVRRALDVVAAGWLVVVLAVLAGCATIDPAHVERAESHAIAAPETTALGKPVFAAREAKAGASAFRLLDSGLDGLAARLALIDAAERTLDLQYYILHGTTAAVVVERLIAAADRGVRVRLLLDDTTTFGREQGLAALDGHPNVEVRSFNPFLMRGPLRITQAAEFMLRGMQLNRRMHNKSFIADNAYAIVGGRNLGDEYFQAEGEVDFQDLDVLAAGPLVADVSVSFDRYWNDPLAVPLAALVAHATDEERARARAFLQEVRGRAMQTDWGKAAGKSAVAREIAAARPPPVWARARVVADAPEKVLPAAQEPPGPLARTVRQAIDGATSELVIISAYFIPGAEGLAALRDARQRGVRVRVLTNSLATTDVVAAHAGYAPYRSPLVAAGVELFELSPEPGTTFGHRPSLPPSGSRASLHAKAVVIDRRVSLLGSLNIDPRSLKLNTEIGILVDSPALAAQVLKRFDAAVAPGNSWRVTLDEGRLRWSGTRDGREVRFAEEPGAGNGRRLAAELLEVLPLESQL